MVTVGIKLSSRHCCRQQITSVPQLEAPGFDLPQRKRSSNPQHIPANNNKQHGAVSGNTQTETELSSPGTYTNHFLLQLTAWTLHKNIEIHNISDAHVMIMATLRLQFPIVTCHCIHNMNSISTACLVRSAGRVPRRPCVCLRPSCFADALTGLVQCWSNRESRELRGAKFAE